ncbi:MAG: YHS domain-containing protein, partial [Acidobacteriota bacterium]|nr:YHS domain-containing protein [Acidobacteriota bacterium]
MDATLQDPVCGMQVDPAKSRFSHEHEGQTYFFCCGGCQTAFATDPAQFLDRESRDDGRAVSMPEGTWFTCPMDPDVRQSTPGACPKCGMALEAELNAG